MLLAFVSWGGCGAGSAAVILYPPRQGLHPVLCLGLQRMQVPPGGASTPLLVFLSHAPTLATYRVNSAHARRGHAGDRSILAGRVTSHMDNFASVSALVRVHKCRGKMRIGLRDPDGYISCGFQESISSGSIFFSLWIGHCRHSLFLLGENKPAFNLMWSFHRQGIRRWLLCSHDIRIDLSLKIVLIE